MSRALSHRSLLPVACVLALTVAILGAYVRLSNAGLGCPDWPGCYGHWVVPQHLGPESEGYARAWIEMTHRYAAGLLGLLIVALGWQAWPVRESRWLGLGLVALVLFQAALGMWTVTLKLLPLVVMAHLLGGMTILALLAWWWLGRIRLPSARPARALRPLALAALLAVTAQIALGGWTSANYAALACPDLPTCQGQWWPAADFGSAFALPSAEDGNYEGGAHEADARVAIHLVHRLGALVVTAAVLTFALALTRAGRGRPALFLLGAVLLQVSLGLANVAFGLPLAVAVAHTAGAAILLLTTLAAARRALSA